MRRITGQLTQVRIVRHELDMSSEIAHHLASSLSVAKKLQSIVYPLRVQNIASPLHGLVLLF